VARILPVDLVLSKYMVPAGISFNSISVDESVLKIISYFRLTWI